VKAEAQNRIHIGRHRPVPPACWRSSAPSCLTPPVTSWPRTAGNSAL